jgi:hypothetical protein
VHCNVSTAAITYTVVYPINRMNYSLYLYLYIYIYIVDTYCIELRV